MQTYPYCTATEFKDDISQLCKHCPLLSKIRVGVRKQIRFQAIQQKDILTKIQFSEYINKEILNAQEAMSRVVLLEQQNTARKDDPFRQNRIEVFIWNKERVKVLNEILNPVAEKNKYPSAVLVGLYCRLLNESGIVLKGESESVSNYCKRACTHYGLKYSDRVRQNFSIDDTRKNIAMVRDIVIPRIDSKAAVEINKYLDSKYPQNPKMYG